MSTLATDNFNRANAASLGANWSTQSGESSSMSIVSNKANVIDICGNYYNAVSWPNNQWCQATAITLTNILWASVRIRCSTSAATYYNGGCNPSDNGNRNRRIWKTVAGTRTSLGSQATDVVVNDVLYLEAQGTSLVLKVNGSTAVSLTDSSIASGSVGMGGRNSSIDSPQFDDWSGGDFGASFVPAWAINSTVTLGASHRMVSS